MTDLIKNPVQFIFLLFAIFTIIILVPFGLEGYIFTVKWRQNTPKNYEFPLISDFWITGVASVVFALIDMFFRAIFLRMFTPYCKEQEDVAKRELRSTKAAGCLYKFVYFTWATSWGYSVLKD